MKSIVVKFAKRLVSKFGGVLISDAEYSQLKTQFAKAICSLIAGECKQYSFEGISCIIFSKDRALQLYSLLETFEKFVKTPMKIHVIYSTSTCEHESSYIELSEITNNSSLDVEFVRESESFGKTLLTVLHAIETNKLFFLTDDDIFIRNVDFAFLSKIDPFKKVVSLRHNPKINFSYTANSYHQPPAFHPCEENKNMHEFNWFEGEYEWSDPWSVDGHIFSTAEVATLTKISDYKFPNSYEASLKSFNFLMEDRKGLCYDESVIINMPINIVLNEYNNISGSIETDYLLKKWNAGFVFDVNFMENHIAKSTPEEQSIGFKKR